MLREIEKDIRRTCTHYHFFQADGNGIHYKNLSQILFIWSKLNPGVNYVQGMNEVLAPLYYIFATDATEGAKQRSAADAFFCFNKVMSEIMNNFISDLDSSPLGIISQMQLVSDILQKKDPQLWNDLVSVT